MSPPPAAPGPAPGQFGAPPPGQFSPPPPGQFGAPPPGPFGAPPPGGGFSPPPPGGFQPAAQPYQYGAPNPATDHLASPGKRIGGRIIDWLILIVVSIPVWIVAFSVLGTTSTTTDSFGNTTGAESSTGVAGFFLIAIFLSIIPALYEICFVALKGQTPGAMIVKVKVVRLADGQIPGWGPAVMRWVPQLVNFVPCIGSFLTLGLWIWALVNLFNQPLRQTPFDLAAKTVVVDVS